MHNARSLQRQLPGLSQSISRRDVVIGTARVTAGAALAALPVRHSLQSAVAQDDVITLVGAASQVRAQPGAAAATSALAEAAAERGAARAQAAAALAHGDSEDGALAQGAAASASADPEEGAIAQGALAVASASSASDESSPVYGGGGRAPRSRGRRIRGRGGKDRTKVKKLPSTGSGTTPPALSPLLAAGAVLAAGGAAVLRGRGVPDEVPSTPTDL
jgi:hypothetical protein